jgi:acyl-CoA hydrolase
MVAKLADGVVTTPRAGADLVVTEHGIAELRGRTLGERARQLAAIADPGFRAELERERAAGVMLVGGSRFEDDLAAVSARQQRRHRFACLG